MHTIAIYGGTFDPVHSGHIEAALNLQRHFHFSSFRFLPCKLPVLKNPSRATGEDRVKMLELALKGNPEFEIDLRELNRDTPSYMVETLSSLREEYQQSSITLIIGYDAFLGLPQWHQWERIIRLANILVIDRQEFSAKQPSLALQEFLKTCQSTNALAILTQTHGKVAFYNAGNYPISSTQIRSDLKHRKNVTHFLSAAVLSYIEMRGLYQ